MPECEFKAFCDYGREEEMCVFLFRLDTNPEKCFEHKRLERVFNSPQFKKTFVNRKTLEEAVADYMGKNNMNPETHWGKGLVQVIRTHSTRCFHCQQDFETFAELRAHFKDVHGFPEED